MSPNFDSTVTVGHPRALLILPNPSHSVLSLVHEKNDAKECIHLGSTGVQEDQLQGEKESEIARLQEANTETERVVRNRMRERGSVVVSYSCEIYTPADAPIMAPAPAARTRALPAPLHNTLVGIDAIDRSRSDYSVHGGRGIAQRPADFAPVESRPFHGHAK